METEVQNGLWIHQSSILVDNSIEKKALISNISGALNGVTGPKRNDIINRQLCHFFRADVSFGMAVASALGLQIQDMMPKQHPVSQETIMA